MSNEHVGVAYVHAGICELPKTCFSGLGRVSTSAPGTLTAQEGLTFRNVFQIVRAILVTLDVLDEGFACLKLCVKKITFVHQEDECNMEQKTGRAYGLP